MDEDDASVVWHDTVDSGTWDCKVVRDAPYHAVLTVTRVADGKVILEEGVVMAYDAIFGPDVTDLNQWQAQALAAIDGSVTEPEGNQS